MQRLVAATLCLVCTGAFPQSIGVSGEGTETCGTYLESRRKPNDVQDYVYVTWVRGFASGHNRAAPQKQVKGSLASGTILAYLDKYCRENPLAPVFAGAVALVDELRGEKR